MVCYVCLFVLQTQNRQSLSSSFWVKRMNLLLVCNYSILYCWWLWRISGHSFAPLTLPANSLHMFYMHIPLSTCMHISMHVIRFFAYRSRLYCSAVGGCFDCLSTITIVLLSLSLYSFRLLRIKLDEEGESENVCDGDTTTVNDSFFLFIDELAIASMVLLDDDNPGKFRHFWANFHS